MNRFLAGLACALVGCAADDTGADAGDDGTGSTSGAAATGSTSGSATSQPGTSGSGPEPGSSTGAPDSDDSGGSDESGSDDSVGSTGAESSCGDGIPDPGELCDDANDIQGDGCNNNCAPSGEAQWEFRWDNPDEPGAPDYAFDAVVDAAGDIYLGGVTRHPWSTQGGEGNNALTMKLSADGELLWVHEWHVGDYESVRGLSLVGDELVCVVEYQDSPGPYEVVLLRYSPDGALLGDATGPGGFTQFFIAAAEARGSAVVVLADGAEPAAIELDPVTAASDWDAALPEEWSVHDLLAVADGPLVVAGNEPFASNRGLAASIGADGTLGWTHAHAAGDVSAFLGLYERDGALWYTGRQDSALLLGQLSADGQPQWDALATPIEDGTGFGSAIVVNADGHAFVGGVHTYQSVQDSDLFVYEFDAAGVLVDEYVEPEGGIGDNFGALLLDADEDRIVVGNIGPTDPEGFDILVRKYNAG